MMSFRFKQIGLALSLMASLLLGHATAACTCSHHDDAEPMKSDCRSHHNERSGAETAESSAELDVNCICFVEPAAPSVSAKSVNKKFRSKDFITSGGQLDSE